MEYCTKFFNALYEIRGPYIDAAIKIKKSTQDIITDSLFVWLCVGDELGLHVIKTLGNEAVL